MRTTEHRTISIAQPQLRKAAAADSRVFDASLSSEEPFERWWGVETLSHAPGAVDLTRAKEGLPLLFGHDTHDPIGVVDNVRLDGRKLRGTIRLFETTRGDEVAAMIRGGLRNMSIGYQIDDVEQTGITDAGVAKMLVKRWTLMEASVAPVPADPTVGVQRSATQQHSGAIMEREEGDRRDDRDDGNNHQSRSQRRAAGADRTRATEIIDTAQSLFKSFPRISVSLRREMDDDVREAIAAGDSAADYQARWSQRMLAEIRSATARAQSEAGAIGLPDDHGGQFSVLRAIRSMMPGAERRDHEEAGYEREVSQDIARRSGRPPTGIYVPLSALSGRRDLTVGTSTAGGHLVATELRGLAEVLRPISRVIELGATVVADLQGNVSFPRETSALSVQWVAEGGAAGEGSIAFDQLAMTPKTVTGWVDFSRRLMKQSSVDVEAVVRRHLTKGIATGIDLAAINGSGSSNQPLGILNTSGINVVELGNDGAAPTWDKLVDVPKEVDVDNALEGRLGWLGNAYVRSKLMKTPKQTSGVEGNFILDEPYDKLLGYLFSTSGNVPANLTKGSGTDLSALIFGNWANLYIGMWGYVDLLVDPYTGSKEGNVRVVAHADCDIGALRGESFAVIKDMVTS